MVICTKNRGQDCKKGAADSEHTRRQGLDFWFIAT
jgi:hypothetical protein